MIIPSVLGATAIGLALYGFLNIEEKDTKTTTREPPEIHDEDLDPRARRERDGRFSPANI